MNKLNLGLKNMYHKPPSWHPNAVPSKLGWLHPKTGEILVADRRLQRKLETIVAHQPKAEVMDSTESIEEIESIEVLNSPIEEIEAVEAVVAKETTKVEVVKPPKIETVKPTKPEVTVKPTQQPTSKSKGRPKTKK